MAQMTFLQLAKRLTIECGVSGSGPATVVNQIGEAGRLVGYINAAWMDIQEQHPDWNWMRVPHTFPTVQGQAIYTPTDCGIATTLGSWKRDTFRNYVTSIGYPTEVFMTSIEYDDWRNLYQFSTLRTVQAKPLFVAVAPDRSLCLGSVPDGQGYTIVCDYFKVPTEMSLDADVPAMPERFQMAIVYRAMMLYGGYESAPEVYQHGMTEFNRLMNRLELDQQPQMMVGSPLA